MIILSDGGGDIDEGICNVFLISIDYVDIDDMMRCDLKSYSERQNTKQESKVFYCRLYLFDT